MTHVTEASWDRCFRELPCFGYTRLFGTAAFWIILTAALIGRCNRRGRS